ncbi:uncharacterized protein LOC106639957 [Copidosoma floridanum]|uniref:uncharacterized protein LOC106639957 n=1 Tax=Copidosoma floridanum TaxID=29053 RepID=UPI0006C97D4C|nr:uncharacterized protein LOC106639957 [Copidosoma floridanum]
MACEKLSPTDHATKNPMATEGLQNPRIEISVPNATLAANISYLCAKPNVPFKKSQNKIKSDSAKCSNKKTIEFINLFSQPEYNSTVQLIKKFDEINEKKPVTTSENSQACKSLINEKISAALEFLPTESVYKNLISLSNYENDNFPVKIMRSKDPESRNKDIIPHLENFYVLKFSEERFLVSSPIGHGLLS